MPESTPRVDQTLIANLKRDREKLIELLASINGEWISEDAVYRFYHQSFKVYRLQGATREIVQALQALVPDVTLNAWFQLIINEGTTQVFDIDRSNANWLAETRPIVEAFAHAKYMLEMACKYSDQEHPIVALASGWAALLYLYNAR